MLTDYNGISFEYDDFLKLEFQWLISLGIFNLWQYIFNKENEKEENNVLIHYFKFYFNNSDFIQNEFIPQKLESNLLSMFLIFSIGLIVFSMLHIVPSNESPFLKNIYHDDNYIPINDCYPIEINNFI